MSVGEGAWGVGAAWLEGEPRGSTGRCRERALCWLRAPAEQHVFTTVKSTVGITLLLKTK